MRDVPAGATVLGTPAIEVAAARRALWRKDRRAMLVAHGKMGDALLVEVREDFLFFTYSVGGIEYTASQDISLLKDRVPPDLSSLLTVGVKYLSQNPANSIVVAEDWSGLRQMKT